MKKKYKPLEIETKMRLLWKTKKCSLLNVKKKKSFCIMIPPPNITGNLHIGHAFQYTIMDIIVRYNKMLGKNTFWQVGLDHAGIATQLLIEKKYFFNKKKYNKINIKFLKKKTWKWFKKIKKKIFFQMKSLGNFIDFSKNRFTLDKKFCKSVIFAFSSLYEKGLIYKKKKIVNWDIKLKTAISDLEINLKYKKNNFFYIKYFLLKNGKPSEEYIVVATTRPETLFGDVAIAVNPKDSRYSKYDKSFVIVPIIHRIIPIIFDSSVKINHGTGCLKITPAHDFNDYEIALKHFLPIIKIMKKNGIIMKKFKSYNHLGEPINIDNIHLPVNFLNLNIKELKKKIILFLKKNKLLLKTKINYSYVPYADRSNCIVEPLLTNQWYLKSSVISKKIFKIIQKDYIKLIPKKYKKICFLWIKNMKDWCISRQSWWGHKIPAWYDKKKNVYVGYNLKHVKKKYNLKSSTFLYQDNNVLDTWFSSSLWTFTTLGWPKHTIELKKFHPTDVIVSGFDIIFFWILRMIMMTFIFFHKKNKKLSIPFKKVYITGLIKDEHGNKMSKSKGNVIDFLDIIKGISLEKLLKKRTKNLIKSNDLKKIINSTKKEFKNGISSYGADSLRFNCALLSSNNKSITWELNKLKDSKSFCNKLWNASKFVFSVLKNKKKNFSCFKNNNFSYNQWILYNLNKSIKLFSHNIKIYRFDLAAKILYNFTRKKFCNWYLEISKIIIFSKKFSKEEKNSIYYTLIKVLKNLLKLLHPIIPFITDYIWKNFRTLYKKQYKSIIFYNFPKYKKSYLKKNKNFHLKWLKKIVIFVRQIKNYLNIKKNKKISLIIFNSNSKFLKFIKKNFNLLKKIAYLKKISFLKIKKKFLKSCLFKKIDSISLYFKIKKFLKKKYNLKNLLIKKIKILKKKKKLENILSNKNFLLNAPKSIILNKKKQLISLKNSEKILYSYLNIL